MFDELKFMHLYERVKKLAGADGALIATAILMNATAVNDLAELLASVRESAYEDCFLRVCSKTETYRR